LSGLLEPKLVHAPEIAGCRLSGEAPSVLRGRAALIDFWDYSCVNCIRTLPYLCEWHRRYAAMGLVVLGIHAPEFRFAREAEAVSHAVREFGIEYGVLLDNDLQLWQRFANRCWPAEYLVDGEGYRHYGEGRYRETEVAIQALLREIDPEVNLPPLLEPLRAVDDESVGRACPRPTGELCLGHARGRVGNLSVFREDSAEDIISPMFPARTGQSLTEDGSRVTNSARRL
jgi:thiol-disulfide isomerase/thioredoxin